MNDLSVYNSVKDRMQTGDLLQWKSNSLLGWAIRWKTGSNVNHSCLVLRFHEYEDAVGRRFTTEALEHGWVLNLLSRRLEQFDGEVWWYPLKEEFGIPAKRIIIAQNALDFIGTPYDYKSIVKQLFGRVSADAKDLFCSEGVYICYGGQGTAPNPGEMPGLGLFKDPVQILGG